LDILVILIAIWYKTPETLEIQTKVIARYDADDLSEIYVYDLNKKLIAICEERKQTHILAATKEDFHSVNLERKNIKNALRDEEKKRRKELEALNLSNSLRIDEKTSEVINIKTGETLKMIETPYDNAEEKLKETIRKKDEKKSKDIKEQTKFSNMMCKKDDEKNNEETENKVNNEKLFIEILGRREEKKAAEL